jgi:hypothetical protein
MDQPATSIWNRIKIISFIITDKRLEKPTAVSKEAAVIFLIG